MPNRLNCISATCTRLITKQGDLIHYYKGVLTSLIGSNWGKGEGGGEEAISIVNQNLPETMTLTIQPYTYMEPMYAYTLMNKKITEVAL